MKLTSFDDARWRKIIVVINIAIAVLILADSFVFGTNEYDEAVSNKKVTEGVGTRNKRYIDWYILSTEGNKYKVPGVTYSKLNPGDTFTVSRTWLFNRPVQISYHYDSEEYYFDNGMVRGSRIGTGAVFIILAISLWGLLFHHVIRQPDDVKLRIVLIADFILVPLLCFYFIAQP